LLGYFGQVDGCNGPDLWYGLPQLIFLNKAWYVDSALWPRSQWNVQFFNVYYTAITQDVCIWYFFGLGHTQQLEGLEGGSDKRQKCQ
jgi:hypothetical protein